MKKHLLVMLCLFFSVAFAMGQAKKITGVVNDEDGVPVIGATVSIVGTSNAVLTDVDGNFALSKVADDAVINVTYVGCIAQQVPVAGKSQFVITLLTDAKQVEEVVVTGYGTTQKRSKVTNSIAKVDEKMIESGVYSNPAQALAGAVAGLRVTTTSGLPTSSPSIVLRGGTNLDGSGSPLIIIDGQLRGSMNDINPEDIESMEVMKDAGATAIYGARASNGVILITTKTGKKGQSAITAKVRIGLNFDRPLYEFLGAEDYITLMRNAYANNTWNPGLKNQLGSAQPFGTGNDVLHNPAAAWNLMYLNDENKFLLDNGNGWKTMTDPIFTDKTLLYKESSAYDYNIVTPTTTQDYNINMSGGNDKGSYYAGLGYYTADGTAIGSEYERLTFTFNGSYKLTDFIKSTSNFSYNRSQWQSLISNSEGNYYGRVLTVPPTLRWEDEEGNMLLGTAYGDGNQQYQSERVFQRFNQTDKFTMVQSFDVNLFPTLKFTASANWYYEEAYAEAFNKDYQTNAVSWNRSRSTSASFNRNFTQTYNTLLNYNETFADKHNVAAMAGFEYYTLQNYGFNASGSGAPTDDFADLSLTDKGENMRNIDSWHSQIATASFFGRLTYDYDGKYLFAASARYDGYSSLLGENRWGFFPGMSAGWVFTKEDFIADAIPALSFGKLRFSAGVNGNASGIGAYTLQGSYGSNKFNGSTGFLIGNLPNPALRWEKTTTVDGGLDLSFFQNRLNANITVYNRLTSDKYAAFALPSTTGFSSVTSNNGEFRNFGVELELSGSIIQKGDWKWDAALNMGYNKNTVVSLPYNGIANNRQNGTEIYTGNGDETMWVGGYQEGQEPGVLTTFVVDGMYTDESQIDPNLIITAGNSVYGNPYGYGPAAYEALSDGEKAASYAITAGDYKWRDINGDGIIDNKDQVVVGNTAPHFTGGLNTTVSWKGLSLFVRADFAFDYWLYDWGTSWIMGTAQGTYNNIVEIKDAWSLENPNGTLPRHTWADMLGPANYSRASQLFTYRGDYFCLREVALSYDLPKTWVSAISCKNVQFTLSAQNLGYLTACKHIATPESGGSRGNAAPLPLTVVGGISITF